MLDNVARSFIPPKVRCRLSSGGAEWTMARAKKDASVRSAAQAFKAIDNKLKLPGGGCSESIGYMEQSSWLLFLRYLDAHEPERKNEALLRKEPYAPALPKELSWSSWAYPKKADGTLDTEHMLVGDELIEFVKGTLLPRLKKLRDTAKDVQSIQYRIGSIFADITCRITNGYLMREIIDLIEPLTFETEAARHEMSVLYESRLQQMGNAGRDGGAYYTPRSLIRVMIRILNPKVGETFYDGASGSCGFICEAYEYMKEHAKNLTKDYDTLQKKTFYAGEASSIAYMTGQMNCILHGLESPNTSFGDTLAQKIGDYTDADRVDVIGANPPFGAGVDPNVKGNFVAQTSETALLFLEHFVAKLKKGGRAAIIVKNTVLSNDDNASRYIRKLLLEKTELEWILDLPPKVFAAGVKAVVLFFRKGNPTTKPINYYELDLGDVSLGKTRPLYEADLAEFEKMATVDAVSSPRHWTIDPSTIDPTTCDLSVHNPNKVEEKPPTVAECEAELKDALAELTKLVKGL